MSLIDIYSLKTRIQWMATKHFGTGLVAIGHIYGKCWWSERLFLYAWGIGMDSQTFLMIKSDYLCRIEASGEDQSGCSRQFKAGGSQKSKPLEPAASPLLNPKCHSSILTCQDAYMWLVCYYFCWVKNKTSFCHHFTLNNDKE